MNGEIVGLFMRVRFTKWESEVHAAIKRPALRYARGLGELFLDRVFADPDVMRVTANVISDLRTAANYCRRLGFRDEGCRRNAVVKNGTALDCIVLGMTRIDWIGRRRLPSHLSAMPLAM